MLSRPREGLLRSDLLLVRLSVTAALCTSEGPDDDDDDEVADWEVLRRL